MKVAGNPRQYVQSKARSSDADVYRAYSSNENVGRLAFAI